jgi:hypothetical protein
MPWAAAAAVAGAVISANSASKTAKAATTANQASIDAAKMDPRLEGVLYGENGQSGLLGQYQALGQAPQSPGLQTFGKDQDFLLQQNGQGMFNGMQGAANNLMTSNQKAPQVQSYGTDVLWNTGESYSAPDAMQAAQTSAAKVAQTPGMQASTMNAASVAGPSQNSLDLTDAYKNLIYGDAGANPYLTKALQGGVDQSQQAFQRMQDDSTRNLTENVLGNIRGNAVLSGQYGGSRQGIAEGRAIGDFGREQQRAIENFGNNNTSATVGAQAQAYNQGQDRSANALNSLSGQQYNLASQNAAMAQQAGMANMGAQNQAAATNYGGLLSGNLANAGYDQQTGMANAGFQQQAGLNNYAGDLSALAGSAGNRQQANLANQQAGNNATMFNAANQQQASSQNAGLQQQTNSMNAANQLAGIGAGQGLLSNLVGNATNQDNYALNRATQTNGLLQPYINRQSNIPASQPVYANTSGAALGGAAAGLGLYNQFNQAQKSNTGNTGSWQNIQNGWDNGMGFGGYAT